MLQTSVLASQFPLHQRPLLRTRDRAAAVEGIHRYVEPFEFSWHSRRAQADIVVTGALLERFKIFGVSHAVPVLVRSQPLRSHYLIVPLRGKVAGAPGGTPLEAAAGEALIYASGTCLDAVWSEQCVALVIVIAPGTLEYAARGSCPDAGARIPLAAKLSLRTGGGPSLMNVLNALCLECDRTPATTPIPIVRERLQDLFLTALLQIQAPAPQPGPDRASTHRRRLGVARAVQFIEQHGTRIVHAHELADAACLSLRSLQTAFIECFGVGPITYARHRRLARVRDALRDPKQGEFPVAQLAVHWGFTDASAFSALYQKRFGETPTQTRRAPRSGASAARDRSNCADHSRSIAASLGTGQ